MYYEESIINKKLMYRNSPDGEWLFKVSLYATTINHMMLLTEEERISIFSHFCNICGSDDLGCQCWNDE